MALMAAAACLGTAGPAGSAFPGENGKIAFTSHRTGGATPGDIFVMEADGSGETQLTSNLANEAGAAFSPDGNQVAFDRVTGGAFAANRDVFVVPATGGKEVPVATGPDNESSPAWSPDGTKLAFDSTRSGDGDIWVVNADGSGAANLTKAPASGDNAAAWSPDGTRIAFHSQRGAPSNTDVYVMNADGSNQTRLTTDANVDAVPSWSPDGTRIVFRRNTLGQQDGDIWAMNADGSGEVKLTEDTAADDNPAWSPDGTKIAFNSARGGTSGDVYVMNADGSNEIPLTEERAADGGPDWQRLIVLPVNGTPPSIPTSGVDGDTVACDPGVWTGGSPTFTYTWLRDSASIAGATAGSYTLTSADVGRSIVCRVTATNASGTASADSNALVPTAPADPPPADPPPADPPPTGGTGPPAGGSPSGNAPLTLAELDATDPPTLGKDVNVAPVSGDVLVSLPAGASASQSVPGLKGRQFEPLQEARQIPVGSFIDTRRGTVALHTARDSKKRIQTGEFAAGVFQVLQSRKVKARGMTELRLKGLTAGFASCGARERSAVAGTSRLSRRAIRRLRARARGRYRTRGRHSAATVRGTVWDTIDRCDGTLTKVRRGKVAVRDFRRKRTILVTRGKRYLARAPG